MAAVLYASSLLLQIPCAWVRSLIALPAIWLLLFALKLSTALVPTLALIAGFAPLAISSGTLAMPIGGPWWRLRSGGRTPSMRERQVYEAALDELRQIDPAIRPPRQWFVLDDPQLNASVYADTISVTRGLLDSPWLTPVLAHELGHLESLDGRILAALYRLTTPPRRPLRFPMRALGAGATGELATWLMLVPWRNFWRAREYDADAHAARLGQGPALADFLQINALDSDLPTPFPWLSRNTHPPTEHRIERLQQITETSGWP